MAVTAVRACAGLMFVIAYVVVKLCASRRLNGYFLEHTTEVTGAFLSLHAFGSLFGKG